MKKNTRSEELQRSNEKINAKAPNTKRQTKNFEALSSALKKNLKRRKMVVQ